MGMKKLIIAEKPSLARNVAAALTEEDFKRADGYSEGQKWIVSYAFGHLFELLPLEDYYPEDARPKYWSMDNLPFFPGQGRPEDFRFRLICKKEKGKTETDEGVGHQFETLRQLMNRADVDEIVHCGDSDREGEVIVRLILQHGLESGKKISRLWLPEQTAETIRSGLENRKPDSIYDNLYNEGICRMLVDWVYGINLSRYVTLKTEEDTVYNIGRVLTPIVKAIYDREMQIKNFVAQPYLQLESRASHKGQPFRLALPDKWEVEDKEQALALCEKLNRTPAVVKDVKNKKKEKKPGRLFSLSKLQGTLGKKFKIPMEDSLAAVQSLYEKGYVTYPRTNSEHLAENEKERVQEVIRQLMETDENLRLILKDEKRIFDDSKIESHSALTPTGKKISGLSEIEQQIYGTILNRFCAVFCEDPCIAGETEVSISCGAYEFSLKGETILSEGYLKYEPEKGKEKLPVFEPGEMAEHEFTLVEKKTQPPKRYNSEALMNFLKNPFRNQDKDTDTSLGNEGAADDEFEAAKKGLEIGTEATRTPIITKAISTGYISQENDIYRLEPKGEAMIRYLMQMQVSMSLETSVELQKWLKDVYYSRRSVAEVLEKAEDRVRADFQMRGQKFESLYAGDPGRGRTKIGSCPKCGKPVYETKNAYSCQDRDCGFALWKNNKYFESIGFAFTTRAAMEFLAAGRTRAEKLPSKKKPGDTYDAILVADFSGKYPQFRMEFEKKNLGKKGGGTKGRTKKKSPW